MDYSIPFLACLFAVGFVYASIGHGGASGYLATMALFGISPALTKPLALILNLFVSTISFIQFYRAGGLFSMEYLLVVCYSQYSTGVCRN